MSFKPGGYAGHSLTVQLAFDFDLLAGAFVDFLDASSSCRCRRRTLVDVSINALTALGDDKFFAAAQLLLGLFVIFHTLLRTGLQLRYPSF